MEIIQIFNKTIHKREGFDCGIDTLNKYLKFQVSQDLKRKLSVCFVLVKNETKEIKGYYTLSNAGIPLIDFPDKIRKKLPKSYNSIPATLLERLAVDLKYQHKGLGELLLVDALKKSFITSLKVGSFAVIVDPINEQAKKFYEKFGFVELPDSKKLFLPMHSLKELVEQ